MPCPCFTSPSRENSARKEGVPVLARYLQRCQAGDQAAPAEAAAEAERSADAAAAASDAPRLGAIKVSCRGVVALKVAAHPAAAVAAAAGTAAAGDGNAGDASAAAGSAAAAAGSDAEFDAAAATVVLRAAAALLADVEGAARGRLQHVQRVVPVQTTCRLEEAALSRAGSRLASLVAEAAEPGRVGSGQEAASGADGCAGSAAAAAAGEQQQRRLTFGISVKQREGEAAGGGGGLGRGAIISSLAAGFEGALRQRHGIAAAVDLTAPAWVLVVEVLPTGEGQYAALAALPAALCAIKPKLLMRVRPCRWLRWVGARGVFGVAGCACQHSNALLSCVLSSPLQSVGSAAAGGK